jgi:hypothetical protein
MKKLVLLLSLAFTTQIISAQAIVSDSATMGPGYGKDVFYSLENGKVAEVANNNWHLAFRSGFVSDGIFINSTNFTRGFLTNKDTSAWETLDSTHATTEVFNTDTSWDIGAFNRTFDSPYCSWGIYNTITHKVTGDSLFLIKYQGGTWIKLWVIEKDYGNWKIRIGTPGRDTTLTILHSNIRSNNFGYVNLLTGTVEYREPADSTWDVVFTRYNALQPAQQVYYPSTGVLNNRGVVASKVSGVDKTTFMDYNANPFARSISAIGADWKAFDNNTFQWKIADSTIYFVKAKDGDIWKLWFTGFGGSGNGKSYFNKQKLFTVGLLDQTKTTLATLAVYPNPASENLTVVLDNQNIEQAVVKVSDLNGRIITEQAFEVNKGMQTLELPVSMLNQGIYLVSLESAGYKAVSKIVIAR